MHNIRGTTVELIVSGGHGEVQNEAGCAERGGVGKEKKVSQPEPRGQISDQVTYAS
jgi:hypothetical protein